MKFTKSIGHSERHRNGIAVAPSVYKGQRRVVIGPAWIKTAERDGTPVEPTPLFMRGVVSLSPEAAETFAHDILAAVQEVYSMPIAGAKPKIKKSTCLAIGQNVVELLSSGAPPEEIVEKIQKHFIAEQSKKINEHKRHYFDDVASQEAFDKNILSSPEKLEIFEELVNKANLKPNEALTHILESNL